jgi:histidinol-phosphate phosphatase family protein
LDFGKDLFPAMVKQGFKLLAYQTPEYIKDIGTPERYDRICAEYAAGVVQRSSLNTPQPAVFLDRDGTLNKEVDGVTSPEKLQLIPGVAEAVHHLNHHGFRVIIVSNQPIVAKGFCTESDIQAVHNKLETLLGREHAFVDRIYYCPHHPDKGFAGERPELKLECLCRKPHPGMIQEAARDLNIDPEASWLIGDTTRDVQTAKNAGLKSILVRTGYAGQDGKYPAQPDFTFDTLNQAVEFILKNKGSD